MDNKKRLIGTTKETGMKNTFNINREGLHEFQEHMSEVNLAPLETISQTQQQQIQQTNSKE